MWFGKGRVVVYQAHFFARNVDQLVAFRFQRANVQETVFGELVQRYQPLAVRFFGFTHSGVVVAGLVAYVQFLYDVIAGFALAGIGIDGFLDVPFHHLAVQEQSGVGIAAAVECGVERAQTQFGFGNHHVALFDFACEQVVQFADIQHGYGRRQFAVQHDVVAVRRSVTAVWRVRHGDVAGVVFGGVGFTAVQYFHTFDFFEIACFNAFFNGFEVEYDAPVLLVGGCFGNGNAFFRVIAGRE